jgi:hypothetical protein
MEETFCFARSHVGHRPSAGFRAGGRPSKADQASPTGRIPLCKTEHFSKKAEIINPELLLNIPNNYVVYGEQT